MTYQELQELTQNGAVNPELVLLNDVSAGIILDTKQSTLAVWRSTGRYNLPFIKIGKRVRYRLSDLLDFLDKRSFTSNAYD
jgi:hypothetical protein